MLNQLLDTWCQKIQKSKGFKRYNCGYMVIAHRCDNFPIENILAARWPSDSINRLGILGCFAKACSLVSDPVAAHSGIRHRSTRHWLPAWRQSCFTYSLDQGEILSLFWWLLFFFRLQLKNKIPYPNGPRCLKVYWRPPRSHDERLWHILASCQPMSHWLIPRTIHYQMSNRIDYQMIIIKCHYHTIFINM